VTGRPTGKLILLPVSLGAGSWTTYLPPDVRGAALQLDYFIVENAKTARAELKRLGYEKPLRETRIETLPETPSEADLKALLRPILDGFDVGLMSEAGCPAVADPGAALVRAAHDSDIHVVPLVGPSSLLLALMASGLNGQSFAFHGYLPIEDAERSSTLVALERESARRNMTQIFIETPYRNTRMFCAAIKACASGTLLCVASNLSTPSESVFTRRIAEWRRCAAPPIERQPTVFLLLAENSAKTHLR